MKKSFGSVADGNDSVRYTHIDRSGRLAGCMWWPRFGLRKYSDWVCKRFIY